MTEHADSVTGIRVYGDVRSPLLRHAFDRLAETVPGKVRMLQGDQDAADVVIHLGDREAAACFVDAWKASPDAAPESFLIQTAQGPDGQAERLVSGVDERGTLYAAYCLADYYMAWKPSGTSARPPGSGLDSGRITGNHRMPAKRPCIGPSSSILT